jgi:hypothetical protein
MLSIHIVREQRVEDVDEKVLPVESSVDLLLRCENLVDRPSKPFVFEGVGTRVW